MVRVSEAVSETWQLTTRWEVGDDNLAAAVAECLNNRQTLEVRNKLHGVVVKIESKIFPNELELSYPRTKLRFKQGTEGGEMTGLCKLRYDVKGITEGAVVIWWRNPSEDEYGDGAIKSIFLTANGAVQKNLGLTNEKWHEMSSNSMSKALEYVLQQLSCESRVDFTEKITPIYAMHRH